MNVSVWYSIENCGDGSAYPQWFLTEGEAEAAQKESPMSWGPLCVGRVETYTGSNVHKEAVSNSKEKKDLGYH